MPPLAAAVGTNQQPVAGLPRAAEHVPYVAFAIANRDHASVGTGACQLSGALKAAQPAHAFRHAVHRVVRQRGIALRRVEFVHPERAAGFGDREPDMGEQPPASRSAAAEIDQPPGLPVAVVIQCRGVLDRENHRFQPAAVNRGLLVRFENMLHRDPVVGKQPVGGLLLRRAGEDHRQRRSRGMFPRPAHLYHPVAQTAIGMGTAPVLDVGPVRILHQVRGRCRTQPAIRYPAQGRAPARSQRLDPYRFRRHRAAPRRTSRSPRGTTLPAGSPVAGAGPLGADIAVGRQRPHPVCRFPIVTKARRHQRQRMRCQVVDPNPGQQEKAVVVDHMPEIRSPRVCRPANEVITRLLVPACRRKADAAEAAVNRRPDPVAKLDTRHPRPALGMMACHHRPPQRSVGIADGLQCHRAEVRKPAGERQIRIVALHRIRHGRHRSRLGQRQTQLVCQLV